MATNLKEDKVMMGFSIAFIIIVLIVLYSLARTAGESDRILENIREQGKGVHCEMESEGSWM